MLHVYGDRDIRVSYIDVKAIREKPIRVLEIISRFSYVSGVNLDCAVLESAMTRWVC